MNTTALWYQFVFHPNRIWQDASQEASRKANDAWKQVRKRIRKFLRELQQNEIQVEIVSESLIWESNPAFWITFDISDPRELHTAYSSVENALNNAIRTAGKDQLEQAALEAHCQTIIAFPLIKGKALSNSAWAIPVHKLARPEPVESDWWNYVQHPIPETVWNQLDISMWTHPRLELVDRFQVAVIALSLLVAHIADLAALPKLDQVGIAILQDHLASYSTRINKTLNQVNQLAVEMVNYFTVLPPEQQARREVLQQGIHLLSEMREEIVPPNATGGQITIQLTELESWSERLEIIRTQSELVRLHWIFDVLENEFSK